MAIALDNTGYTQNTSLSANGTLAYTVNSNTNGILLAGIFIAANESPGTITYAGSTMTLVGTAKTSSNTSLLSIYYLPAPNTGNNNLIVNLATSGKMAISALSLTGAAQNAPEANVFGSATSGTAIGTITTINNNAWVVDAMLQSGNGTKSVPESTNQTAAGLGTPNQTQLRVTGMSYIGTVSPAGNTTMAWGTATGAWAQGIISIAPASGGAGTNLIQSSGTAVLGIGSTSTVWGANTTTGNLVTVGVTLTNAAALGTVSSITDSQSNTYTKALSGTLSSLSDVLNVELWYAKNISGGAGSVTVNHTVDNCAMFAREYKGYNTLDGTSANNGSSTTPNSGTVTTNFGTELLVVATGDDKSSGQTWTAAGAFGDMVGTQTTITGQSMEDNIVTSSGAQTGTLTLGAAANWESLMATFYNQIASSGGPGYKTLLGEGKS